MTFVYVKAPSQSKTQEKAHSKESDGGAEHRQLRHGATIEMTSVLMTAGREKFASGSCRCPPTFPAMKRQWLCTCRSRARQRKSLSTATWLIAYKESTTSLTLFVGHFAPAWCTRSASTSLTTSASPGTMRKAFVPSATDTIVSNAP